MIAAKEGDTDTVVQLVRRGADMDMQNKVCCLWTKLHYLVSIRGIDWSSVITQNGDTALILASGQCGTEAIVELVKAGADVNLQNNVCWCCV